jgi:hydrogenase nickel incorporation protein HypA/HybF
MHEMALAEGILAVVLDAAEEQQVQRVRLRVGTLQRVVPDSLQFSFQLIAEDTPAVRATLDIQRIPARVRCGRCGRKSSLEQMLLTCRDCGAVDPKILSGDELIVDGIELERGWRYRPRPAPAAATRNHLLDHLLQAVGGVGPTQRASG